MMSTIGMLKAKEAARCHEIYCIVLCIVTAGGNLRPASAQVSSKFSAGFRPDSIMDFGLNKQPMGSKAQLA